MNFSLFFRTDASILCLILFIACLLMVKTGHALRIKFLNPDEPESKGGVNSLMGALFGLWGFLLAFTFGNSATRFENVRNVMVDETNAIRNAIMRSRVFNDSLGAPLRANLAEYLQARVDYYNSVGDNEKFVHAKMQSQQLAEKLWDQTVEIAKLPNQTFPSSNMFASLTSMFDIATKRDALLMAGVPEPIQYMLFTLALVLSFIGGFTTPAVKSKEWIVITGFVLLACCIIYITLDLGRPMRGIIKPESVEQRIEELKHLLK
ncbi:MAG TPA: hypothetical protein VLC98_05435 [Phnomibacter sp.]|nr:hypothetical protein [Phnomibacter sp.]